jgi:primase-polymerase (primpol)-like protein
MPAASRSDAKYCDGACRVAALRDRRKNKTKAPAEKPVLAARDIPDALPELRDVTAEYPVRLQRLARWVRRSAKKVPLTVAGAPASSTDPSTWTTFQDAADASSGTGLGFVLDGDGIGCIDLDHCLVDGELTPAAERVLSSLPPTYIEVSMSGDGLHIFGTGVYVSSRKLKRPDLQGEVIGARKYVAVTGQRFRNAPLTLGNISNVAGALIS